MPPTTAYYPPGPEDRPPEPRRPEPERFDPRPPPGGRSLWWDYARSLIGPFEEPTSLWPWFDYETPDPYLDPYYYPNVSGHYPDSLGGDGSGRQIGRYDDRDTSGASGDPDLFGAVGAVAAPSAPAPEDRWTSAVAKVPEGPERPKKAPPRVKPTKRRKVGEKSLWWRYTQMLIDGINPVTGQPFGFDLNKGPDSRRYSFPTSPDDDGPPEVEEQEEEKLDKRHVYATGTRPREEEPPAKKSRKVRRRPRARVRQARRTEFDLFELLTDCPVPSSAERQARGLEDLDRTAVPASVVVELQQGLRSQTEAATTNLQEAAERILQPAITKEVFEKEVAAWPEQQRALIQNARSLFESQGGRDWDTSRWLGLAEVMDRENYLAGIGGTRRNFRPGDRAWYETAWEFKRHAQRHAAIQEALRGLKHTQVEERRQIAERLAAEVADVEDLGPQIAGLGVAGPESASGEVSALELWRRYCRAMLHLRHAVQLHREAEVAEAAITAYERFLDTQDENSFFGTGINLGLYSTQDAPEQMVRALTANIVNNRRGELIAEAWSDERLQELHRALIDEQSSVFDAQRDNRAVAAAMDEVHRWAGWLTNVAEDTAIDIATAGLIKGLTAAAKATKFARRLSQARELSRRRLHLQNPVGLQVHARMRAMTFARGMTKRQAKKHSIVAAAVDPTRGRVAIGLAKEGVPDPSSEIMVRILRQEPLGGIGTKFCGNRVGTCGELRAWDKLLSPRRTYPGSQPQDIADWVFPFRPKGPGTGVRLDLCPICTAAKESLRKLR